MLESLAAALADRYTIEREIGAGGMGTVYLARELKHDRQVALKVLRPEIASHLGVVRFLNEVKVTAKREGLSVESAQAARAGTNRILKDEQRG